MNTRVLAFFLFTSLAVFGAPATANPCAVGACPVPTIDDPIACWKPTEVRKRESLHCAPGLEQSGGLCYEPCEQGFDGVANVCKRPCGSGYRMVGKKCVSRTDPNDTFQRKYTRGAGEPLSYCPPHLEKVGAQCMPPCPEGFYGIAGVCWGECPVEMRGELGAICALDQDHAAAAVSEMVTAPIEAAADIGMMIFTAGSGTAAKSASQVATSGVKMALTATLKTMAKKLGQELAEGAAEAMATTLLEGLATGEFDWAELDPTGLTSVVEAFNYPICNQRDPMEGFDLAVGRALAGNNDRESVPNVSLGECAQRCEADPGCASADYYFPASTCQLSSASRDTAPSAYGFYETHAYFHKLAPTTVSCAAGSTMIEGACVTPLTPDPILTRDEAEQACYDRLGGTLCSESQVREAYDEGLHMCVYTWTGDSSSAGAEMVLSNQSEDLGCGPTHAVSTHYTSPSERGSGACCSSAFTPPPRCPEGAIEVNGTCVKALPGGYRFTRDEAEDACEAYTGGELCEASQVQEAFDASYFHHCAYSWVANVGADGTTYTALPNEGVSGAGCEANGVNVIPFAPSTKRSAICCSEAQ